MKSATFIRRFLAFVIDVIIVVSLFSLLIWLLNVTLRLPVENSPLWERGLSIKMDDYAKENFLFLVALYSLAKLVVIVTYFALLESSRRQATFGKVLLRIKVVNSEGERISFGRASLRLFGKFISGQILGIGYLMAAFRADGKALHDLIAATRVVKAN